MSNYHEFNHDAIESALESVRRHYGEEQRGIAEGAAVHSGQMSLSGGCISVTIENAKVCLNLPLGIGKVCIPVPLHFDGQVAQACLHICTTIGIPTGVEVTISVAGTVIAKASYGKC